MIFYGDEVPDVDTKVAEPAKQTNALNLLHWFFRRSAKSIHIEVQHKDMYERWDVHKEQ